MSQLNLNLAGRKFITIEGLTRLGVEPVPHEALRDAILRDQQSDRTQTPDSA